MMANYGNAIFLPDICQNSIYPRSISNESQNFLISDSQIIDVAKELIFNCQDFSQLCLKNFRDLLSFRLGATSANEKRALIRRFDRKHLEHVKVLGRECRQAIQAYQSRYSRPLFAGTSTTELDRLLNHEYYLAYITYRAVNQVINFHNYYNSSKSTSKSILTTTSSSGVLFKSSYSIASSISSVSSLFKLNRTITKHRRHHLKAFNYNSNTNSSSRSKNSGDSSNISTNSIIYPHHHTSSPSLSPTSDKRVPAKILQNHLQNSKNSAFKLKKFDISSANCIFRRSELIYPPFCASTFSVSVSNTTTIKTLVPRLTRTKFQSFIKSKSALFAFKKNKMVPGSGEKKPTKGCTTQSKQKTNELAIDNNSSEVLNLSKTQQTVPSIMDKNPSIFRDTSMIRNNNAQPLIGEQEEMAMAQLMANQQQLLSNQQQQPAQIVPNVTESPVIVPPGGSIIEGVSPTLDEIFQDNLTLLQSSTTLRSKLRHLNELLQGCPSPSIATSIYHISNLDFYTKVHRSSTFRTFNLAEIPRIFLMPSTNMTALTRELDRIIGEVGKRRQLGGSGIGQTTTTTTSTTTSTTTNLPIQNQSLLNLQYLQSLEQQQQSSQSRQLQQQQLPLPAQSFRPVSSSSLSNLSKDAATTNAAAAATTTTDALTPVHKAPELSTLVAETSNTAAAAAGRSTVQRTETTPVLSISPKMASSFSTFPVAATSLPLQLKEASVHPSPALVSGPSSGTVTVGCHIMVNNTTTSSTATVVPAVVAHSAPAAAAVSGTTGTVVQQQSQWEPPALLREQLQGAPMAFSGTGSALQAKIASKRAELPPAAAKTAASARLQPPEAHPSESMQQGISGTPKRCSKTAEVRPVTATCLRASDHSGHSSITAPSPMNPPSNPRQMTAVSAAAATVAAAAEAATAQQHQQQQQQLLAIMNQTQNSIPLTPSQLLQIQLFQSNFLHHHQQPRHHQQHQANIFNPLLVHNSGVLSPPPPPSALPGVNSAGATSTIRPFLQSAMISPQAAASGESDLPAEPTIDTSLRLLFSNDTSLNEQQRQLVNGAIINQLQQQQQNKMTDPHCSEPEQPENLQVKHHQPAKQKQSPAQLPAHQLQHQQTLKQSPYLFPGSPTSTSAFHQLPPQLMGSTPPATAQPPTSAYSMERILSPVSTDSAHSYHHAHHYQQQAHPHRRPEKNFEMSDDERSLASSSSSIQSRTTGTSTLKGAKEAPGATSVLVMARKPSRSSISSSSQKQSTCSSDSIISSSTSKNSLAEVSQKHSQKNSRSYSDTSEVVHSTVGSYRKESCTDKDSYAADSSSDNNLGNQQASSNKNKPTASSTISSSTIDFSPFSQNSKLSISEKMLLNKKKASIHSEGKDLRISKHQSLSAIANLQENKFQQKAVESTKNYIAGLFEGSNSLAKNRPNLDHNILGEGGESGNCDDKSKNNSNDNGTSIKNDKTSAGLLKNNLKSADEKELTGIILSEKPAAKPISTSEEYFNRMLTARKTPKGGTSGKKTVPVRENFSSSSSSPSSSRSSSNSSRSSNNNSNSRNNSSSGSESSSEDDSDNERASKKSLPAKGSYQQKSKSSLVKPKSNTTPSKSGAKNAKGQKRPLVEKKKIESVKKKKITSQKTAKKGETSSKKKKISISAVSGKAIATSEKVGSQRRPSKLPLTEEERRREEQAKRDEEYARLLAHEYWEESRPGRRAKAAEATSKLHEIFTRARLPMEADAAFQLQQIALMDAKTKHDEALKQQQQQQQRHNSDSDDSDEAMRCKPSTSRDALGRPPFSPKKVDTPKPSSSSQNETKQSKNLHTPSTSRGIVDALPFKSAKVKPKVPAVTKSGKKDSKKTSKLAFLSSSSKTKKANQSSSKRQSSNKGKSSCKSSVQSSHKHSSDDDDSDSSNSYSSSKDNGNKSSKSQSSFSTSVSAAPPSSSHSSSSSPPKTSGKSIMISNISGKSPQAQNLFKQQKIIKLQSDDDDNDDSNNNSDSDDSDNFCNSSVSSRQSTTKKISKTSSDLSQPSSSNNSDNSSNDDSDSDTQTRGKTKKPKKKRKKVIDSLSSRIKSQGFLMTTPYDTCPKFVWFFKPLLKKEEKITINRLCKIFWQYIQENKLRFKRNDREYIRFTKRMCRLFDYDYFDDREVSHSMGKVGKNLVKMHIDFQHLKNENSTPDESTDTEADRLRREQVMARFMVKEEEWNLSYDDEIPMEVIDKMRKLRHINNELSDSDDDDDCDFFNNEDNNENDEKLNELAQKWTLLKLKKEEVEMKLKADEEKRKKEQEKINNAKKSLVDEKPKQFPSKSISTPSFADTKMLKNHDNEISKNQTVKDNKKQKVFENSIKTKCGEPKLSKVLPKLNNKESSSQKSFSKVDHTNFKSVFKVDKKETVRQLSPKYESSSFHSMQKSSKSLNLDHKNKLSSSQNKNEKLFQEKLKSDFAKLSVVSKSFSSYDKNSKSHNNEKDKQIEKFNNYSKFHLEDINKKEKLDKGDQHNLSKYKTKNTEKEFSTASGSNLHTDHKKSYFSCVDRQIKTERKNDIKGNYENKNNSYGFNSNSRNSNNKRRLEEENNKTAIKKSR